MDHVTDSDKLGMDASVRPSLRRPRSPEVQDALNEIKKRIDEAEADRMRAMGTDDDMAINIASGSVLALTEFYLYLLRKHV